MGGLFRRALAALLALAFLAGAIAAPAAAGIDPAARGIAAAARQIGVAAQAANRGGQHVCLVGDSIFDHNSVRPNNPAGAYGGTAYSETLGPIPWWLGLNGSSQYVWDPTFDNFAVSGDQTGDILARMGPILARRCDIYILEPGTNDITSQITVGGDPVAVLAGLKSRYLNILGQLQATNARVVVWTLLPRGGASGQTGPMRFTLLAFNSWLREYASRNNIELIDAHSVLADPLSAVGGEIAGTMASDHIHPNAVGGFMLGQYINSQFANRSPQSYRYQLSAFDTYDATYNPGGNLLAGAQFTSSTAMTALSGITASGVLPAGFTIARAGGTGTTGTLVGSLVAAADGNGNWLQLDFGSINGTTEIFQFQEFITASKVATGDIIDCWGQVAQLAGSAGGALNELSWVLSDGSASPAVTYTGMAQGTNAGTIPTTAFTATWQVPADLVPTPTTVGAYSIRIIGKVSIAVTSSYTGSVRFRLPTCRKRISALELTDLPRLPANDNDGLQRAA